MFIVVIRFAEVPVIVIEMERRVERIKHGRGIFLVRKQSESKKLESNRC